MGKNDAFCGVGGMKFKKQNFFSLNNSSRFSFFIQIAQQK
jgi:hypothetical protein